MRREKNGQFEKSARTGVTRSEQQTRDTHTTLAQFYAPIFW